MDHQGSPKKVKKKKILHFEVDPNKIHTHNCLISLYVSLCLFFPCSLFADDQHSVLGVCPQKNIVMDFVSLLLFLCV